MCCLHVSIRVVRSNRTRGTLQSCSSVSQWWIRSATTNHTKVIPRNYTEIASKWLGYPNCFTSYHYHLHCLCSIIKVGIVFIGSSLSNKPSEFCPNSPSTGDKILCPPRASLGTHTCTNLSQNSFGMCIRARNAPPLQCSAACFRS